MSEKKKTSGSKWKKGITILFRTYRKYGISKEDYLRLKLYEKPEDERIPLRNLDRYRKEERIRLRKTCIGLIRNQEHCTKEKAKEKLDRIRTDLKLQYDEILQLEAWAFSLDSLEADYAKALEKKQQARHERKHEIYREEKQYFVQRVMDKTGWSREETISRIEKVRKMLDCDYVSYFYKEYYIFNLYSMTEEQQKGVYLFCHSQKFRVHCDVNMNLVRILKNKEETNLYFSEFIKCPWCVNVRVTFEEFEALFRNSTRIIYKPIRGHRGHGVTAYDLTAENHRAVYEELAQLEEGMVEEYVVQHPVMNTMCPASVNTLRVVTVCSKKHPVTADGKYFDFAYTTLRIGGGTAVVDNFHGGGMCALADLATGKLITPGVNEEGDVFEKHPVTGTVIKGFEIPFYKEALSMIEKACRKTEVAGYLGWDVAITENGPLLIEANTVPSIGLLSAPCGAEKISSRAIIEKFM